MRCLPLQQRRIPHRSGNSLSQVRQRKDVIDLRAEIEFATGLECISGAERAERLHAVAARERMSAMRSSGLLRLGRTVDLLLMDKADLTIIVQRSLMDRNDRCAGHHLLDVQGRQRGVQLPEHGEVVEHPLNHGIDQLSWLITR